MIFFYLRYNRIRLLMNSIERLNFTGSYREEGFIDDIEERIFKNPSYEMPIYYSILKKIYYFYQDIAVLLKIII